MLKRSVLVMLLVCGLSSVLSAGVALNQDFDGFALGSLGTAGQGATSEVGGKWWTFYASTDPSIVTDPDDPNNGQCVRITGGQGMLVGTSAVASIAKGTPFILSFSVYPVNWSLTDVGSFYLYADNLNSLSPSGSGIAMHNYTIGNFVVWDGQYGGYRSIDRLWGINLFESQNTWVDVKIHVTTWNDGTGYGRYDIWCNDSQGLGWRLVEWGNPFSASALHDGVDALLFRPRMPSSGVLAYFDNIYFTTEPLDCQDAFILGQNLENDIDLNCTVDMQDFALMAPSWLEQAPSLDDFSAWEYKWDCDELPQDAEAGGLWERVSGPGSTGLNGTDSVNNGIYTASTANTQGAELFHRTVEGVYDGDLPAMLAFRTRCESTTERYTTVLTFYKEGYGYMGLNFRPYFYYEDESGWTNYRVVTYVEDGEMLGADLYYQDQDGYWVFGEAATLWLESSISRDLFYYGDAGSVFEGIWYEDYFHWTQQQELIDDFLAALALQPADLNNDGRIDLKDFGMLGSEWLQDVNP